MNQAVLINNALSKYLRRECSLMTCLVAGIHITGKETTRSEMAQEEMKAFKGNSFEVLGCLVRIHDISRI